MNAQTLNEVQHAKVRTLVRWGKTFMEQVQATNNLEQKALVSSRHLPREIEGFQEIAWDELCVRWGMRVLGNMRADFFAVQLPDGWRLKAVETGSLWSLLLDDLGRERASLFYRPSADDHSAAIYLNKRYSVYSHYLDPTDHTVRIISARDQRRIFHEFGRVPSSHLGYFYEVQRVEEVGQRWMDVEFPGWRDPFAYWDS